MNAILKNLYDIRTFFGDLITPNLWWMQIVSLILSGLLIWGIIYIILKSNYLEMKKEQFLDILGRGHVSRHRSMKGWIQIKKRMKSNEQNQWKLAILEASRILNEILKMSGYLGDKLEDKLELITPAQLSNVDELKRVNGMNRAIADDPAFEITREEAEEAIEIYHQALKELNLLRE